MGFYILLRVLKCDPLVEQSRKELCKDPCFIIEQLATHPDHNGKGVGTLLLKAVTDIADKQNKVCYLECSGQKNLGFYSRRGFEKKIGWERIECYGSPVHNVGFYGMLRSPS